MMKFFHFLFLFCLLSFNNHAQTTKNLMLDFYYPNFQENVPLETDSAIVVNQNSNQIYSYAFNYDSDHQFLQTRTKIESQGFSYYTIKDYIRTAGKLTILETYKDLIWQSTSYTRQTIDSINGKISHVLYEQKNGNDWVRNQEDSFYYDNSMKLIKRVSYFQDNIINKWKIDNATLYEYDSQYNLINRYEISFGNTIQDTTLFNQYNSTYDNFGNVVSETWFAGLSHDPIDKATYSYDNGGNLDSLNFYDWIPQLQNWLPYSYYVFDDSPEQQNLRRGKVFKFNLQQPYLYEESFFTPGPHIYTDQPEAELTTVWNAVANQMVNEKRRLSNYTELPDGTIKGEYIVDQYKNNAWQNDMHFEAWMHKIKSVSVASPVKKIVKNCGLPNPANLMQLEGVTDGNKRQGMELELIDMSGRLVLAGEPSQILTQTPVGLINDQWYGLRIMENNKMVCVQKIFIR